MSPRRAPRYLTDDEIAAVERAATIAFDSGAVVVDFGFDFMVVPDIVMIERFANGATAPGRPQVIEADDGRRCYMFGLPDFGGAS